MKHPKDSSLYRTVAALALLILGAPAPYAEADKTIPIGVDVRLPAAVTGHWSQGRYDTVRGTLADRIVELIHSKHRHWDFSRDLDGTSQAAVVVSVAEGVPDEQLLRLELHLRPPSQAEVVFELGDVVLYEPGHFDSYGLPTESELEDRLWSYLRVLLTERRDANLNTLKERVPLARHPSPIDPTDRTVVLPLPKERFDHLAFSVFRLYCPSPQPTVLYSQGDDSWDSYDQEIPVALKVTLRDEPPGADLQGLSPALVYLEELVDNTNWFVDEGGSP